MAEGAAGEREGEDYSQGVWSGGWGWRGKERGKTIHRVCGVGGGGGGVEDGSHCGGVGVEGGGGETVHSGGKIVRSVCVCVWGGGGSQWQVRGWGWFTAMKGWVEGGEMGVGGGRRFTAERK